MERGAKRTAPLDPRRKKSGRKGRMKSDETFLVQQARMVLHFNWTGEYTKPGPRLYPHQ
jgi:hypothetical protein